MIPQFNTKTLQNKLFQTKTDVISFDPATPQTDKYVDDLRDKVILNDVLIQSEKEKLQNIMRINGFPNVQISILPPLLHQDVDMVTQIVFESEARETLEEALEVLRKDRYFMKAFPNTMEELMMDKSLEWDWIRLGGRNVSHTFTSKDEAWRTPDYIYDYFDKIYKFNFDAAASKENARTKKYLTKQDDALSSSWCRKGRRIWLNPPYSRNLYPWIEKAYEESKKGCIVAILIYSRTDTKWWHDFVIPHAYKVHFIRPRIKFLDSKTGKKKGSATAPSCLIVFKPNKRKSFLVEGDTIRDA